MTDLMYFWFDPNKQVNVLIISVYQAAQSKSVKQVVSCTVTLPLAFPIAATRVGGLFLKRFWRKTELIWFTSLILKPFQTFLSSSSSFTTTFSMVRANVYGTISGDSSFLSSMLEMRRF